MSLLLRLAHLGVLGTGLWALGVAAAVADDAIEKVQRVRRKLSIPEMR